MTLTLGFVASARDLNRKSMSFCRYTVLAAALCIPLASGCGGPEGPKKYAISGTVTREGKPIAEGVITMAPTGEGPATQTTITDGQYEFSDENGPIEGDHTVTILRMLQREEVPPGTPKKDAEFIPETGFTSTMPDGGWVLSTTIAADQDVGEPVDFNVDQAN